MSSFFSAKLLNLNLATVMTSRKLNYQAGIISEKLCIIYLQNYLYDDFILGGKLDMG